MKNLILKQVAIVLVALGFTACDEVSDAGKKVIASVSIEQPIVTVEHKLVEQKMQMFGITTGTGQYSNVGYIKIVSKDNNTELQNVIVNRGNCGVKRYQLNNQAYKEFAAQNPDNIFAGEGAKLNTKSGELVKAQKIIYSDSKGMAYYENLDEKSKALYELASEFRGEKLPFGSSAIFYPNCKADSIIELEVMANGGSFTYGFGQGF